jgi:hypothetical protein
MIEDSKTIVVVFLDFKRAFETIDRELLLRRMEQYGIKGAELSWFRNYLSQETKFYEKIFYAIKVQLGLPQGSVLGLLLFIFYIKNVLRYSKLNLFADDTLLYIAIDTFDEAVNRMNDDLLSLSQWLTLNKLKLNVQKTK